MRASDGSPWWLVLPALAGCGRLPPSDGLRRSLLSPPMQAGRSDLCSRHQHGSAGHSACFVIRVTQLCRISQVYRHLARGARLMDLATTHTPSYARMIYTAWMQGALGHAAWVCVCQIANQWLKRAFTRPVEMERLLCSCVLAGVVLSAQAGRGLSTGTADVGACVR